MMMICVEEEVDGVMKEEGRAGRGKSGGTYIRYLVNS